MKIIRTGLITELPAKKKCKFRFLVIFILAVETKKNNNLETNRMERLILLKIDTLSYFNKQKIVLSLKLFVHKMCDKLEMLQLNDCLRVIATCAI